MRLIIIIKAIAIKSGTTQNQANYCRKSKPSNGNRRERKLRAEMKRLTQQIARTSNEIYRRTQKRKATTKEKELLNELKKLMGGVDPTKRMLESIKRVGLKKLETKRLTSETH